MNKKLYIALISLSIIFICIGGTFALVTNSIATNITQIKSGNLTMTIDGGGSVNTSFVPTNCTSENAIKKKIVATTTNTSGGIVSFSIGLDVITLSDTYKRDTIRYALTTEENSCNNGVIAKGSFSSATVGTDIWLIKNDYDNITKSGNNYTKTYYLYIWMDESETEYIDGSISVKLKGSTSNNPNLTTSTEKNKILYQQIKDNADTTTIIDFSKTSAQDSTNGIYTTTDTESGMPVYYYRGAVTDNNVIFANYCWKIVRTTETGGVKLIYTGIPSNGQCNTSTNIGTTKFNAESNSLTYVGYMYGEPYEPLTKNITELTSSIAFANSVNYDESTNEYILYDTYNLKKPSDWESEYDSVAGKYHYTCFTANDTCTEVNYIYNIDGKIVYYYTLSNGKIHSDILEEMLSENINNSTIKETIDTWYEDGNIINTDYESYLEDTVFCNDRSFDTSTGGWDLDSNNYNTTINFGSYQRIKDAAPSLICPREVDKFTIDESNGNGALTYPVGLITADEMIFAGNASSKIDRTYHLYKQSTSFSISPYWNNTSGVAMYIPPRTIQAAIVEYTYATTSLSVYPVISLRSGVSYAYGDGTASAPFVII